MLFKTCFLFFLAWPVHVQARTLSQLRTDARVLVSDNGSRNRFTDAIIDNWLSEAQRLLAARTMCFRASINIALSARTTYYSMPSNYIAPMRVVFNDMQLTEMSVGGMDAKSRGWETATGSPVYYFINFSSRGVLGFAPFPGTAEDGDIAKVEYYAYPNPISSDSDVPFNGNPEFASHQHGLPFYAAGQMSLIDGRQDQAKAFFDIFLSYEKLLSESCNANARPEFRPQASGRQ